MKNAKHGCFVLAANIYNTSRSAIYYCNTRNTAWIHIHSVSSSNDTLSGWLIATCNADWQLVSFCLFVAHCRTWNPFGPNDTGCGSKLSRKIHLHRLARAHILWRVATAIIIKKNIIWSYRRYICFVHSIRPVKVATANPTKRQQTVIAATGEKNGT